MKKAFVGMGALLSATILASSASAAGPCNDLGTVIKVGRQGIFDGAELKTRPTGLDLKVGNASVSISADKSSEYRKLHFITKSGGATEQKVGNVTVRLEGNKVTLQQGVKPARVVTVSYISGGALDENSQWVNWDQTTLEADYIGQGVRTEFYGNFVNRATESSGAFAGKSTSKQTSVNLLDGNTIKSAACASPVKEEKEVERKTGGKARSGR